MSESVELDIAGRRDAFAHPRRRAPHRPYLVQSGPRNWLVHATAPGDHHEPLLKALAAIDDCLRERRVEDADFGIGGLAARPEKSALDAASALR